MSLATDRLILRRWRDSDREPFAALNADPAVMAFFPATRTRAESVATQDRLANHIDKHGFGFWALELRETGEMIGFTGLQNIDFEAPFCPAVEIGWRLARKHWGQGYATEAAFAALDYGFGPLGLDEIVSFAGVANHRSQAVMQRIGMHRDPQFDFDHPTLEPESPIARHAFYRIRRLDHTAKSSD